MRKFQYRIPRYRVNLPVRLDFSNESFQGRCREISQEGMYVELQHAPGSGERGTAFIRWVSAFIDIGVCVVRTEARNSFLKFIFQSDKEYLEIAHLLSLVAAQGEQPGPFVVK
jgi:hypothetical protein